MADREDEQFTDDALSGEQDQEQDRNNNQHQVDDAANEDEQTDTETAVEEQELEEFDGKQSEDLDFGDEERKRQNKQSQTEEMQNSELESTGETRESAEQKNLLTYDSALELEMQDRKGSSLTQTNQEFKEQIEDSNADNTEVHGQKNDVNVEVYEHEEVRHEHDGDDEDNQDAGEELEAEEEQLEFDDDQEDYSDTTSGQLLQSEEGTKVTEEIEEGQENKYDGQTPERDTSETATPDLDQKSDYGETSKGKINSFTAELAAEQQEKTSHDNDATSEQQEEEQDLHDRMHADSEQEKSDVNANAKDTPTTTSDDIGISHLPSPDRSYTNIEGQMSTSALNVVWSFGLNRNVPVLNLSDGFRQAIMYPCAHVGIMYDFKNNKQHILQAHLNPITCSAVSQDKRWLVTGDVGPDAMVNIWDTYTGTPIQTMFDPNPQGGVVAVALTPDSRFLATLSSLTVQTLAIWNWTVDGDVPICSADLKPEFGIQNFIYFDPTDINHLVTNSESQVLFYNWEENYIKFYAPPLTDRDFNKPVGRYSQSLFQIGIARALTGTSLGNLVVWDNNRPLSKMYIKPEIDVWTGLPIMDVNQSADKKPLKIIKVHDKGISVLTNTDNYIVIGDTAGQIKFFDQGLRLIYWYQDVHAGPCTAVSFAHNADFVPSAGNKYPSDATKQGKPFIVRDFIVGTAIAVYCSVVTDGTKMKIIHREHDAAVHAIDCHPRLPIVAVGSYSGLLKLWNYRTKEVIASRVFDKSHIHCVAFDPKGFLIAVGCTNGTVYLVDSVALLHQINEPYKYAYDIITHIAFSHNSTYFATADAGFTITVYKRQRKEGRNPYIWHGRYRSHYKLIKDLIFDIHLDTNEPKLLSLGDDRMLIEYDLHHVGKTNNHVVPCAEDRIEQGAIPLCLTKYPPIGKEHFFLTANDQFKLKCYNSTTKMCRKTVLGPTYGSPIRKMMIVPTVEDESKNRFMAYITDDKVGLHFLPATGNPHLAMALIAHPSGVSNLTCSFDGAYLFTAGGPDFAVHMWEINIVALEAQCKLGGEDLVPFYGLLEGGRDGELFAELEDLFYYAQLRNQGISSIEKREISNKVPITEVPFIMRAMGFYPSEQEIQDMLNEIKYDEYVNLGYYQQDIDLGRFIKLYVNHRPAFGLSPEKLLWAFKTLSESPEIGKGGIIDRGDFLQMLQQKGEFMTESEVAEHMATLLGFNREGGTCEEETNNERDDAYVLECMPFDINAEILINEILGFSMTVDPPAAEDTKNVIKSGAA